MFTNVSSPLHWNFSGDTIPDSLKDAPYFLLNNPVALQRKYLKLKDDPNMKKTSADLRKAVKAGEENAMGMLVELFDWLDGLEPQPIMGMVPLHGERRTIEGTIENTSGSMGEVAAKKEKKPVSLYLTYISAFNSPSLHHANVFCHLQKRTRARASKQMPASDDNYFCIVPNCSSYCSIRLSPIYVLVTIVLPWLQLVLCSRCAHPYLFHVRVPRFQRQRDLNHNVADEPPPSADDNAGPWPSGGLSTRVERAIQLLEQSQTDMEEKGVSRKQLGSMQRSLKHMKWGLDLPRKAKEKVWEGIRKVKQVFFRS